VSNFRGAPAAGSIEAFPGAAKGRSPKTWDLDPSRTKLKPDFDSVMANSNQLR
jgi:hypothetical protein